MLVCVAVVIGALAYSFTLTTHPTGRTTTSISTQTVVTVGYGMLRVYSEPALPTTVIVNNVRRDDGGLNWVRLAPGTYTVHFTGVPGYARPTDQTVTVNDNATTTVAGKFTQLGSLHVVTNPPVPATISIDGEPRDDWGVWLSLSPGSHTVHFGDVANYTSLLVQP